MLHFNPLPPLTLHQAPSAGIDAEVAQFFAQAQRQEAVVIDEATNVRLRRKVHKRVLVCFFGRSVVILVDHTPDRNGYHVL